MVAWVRRKSTSSLRVCLIPLSKCRRRSDSEWTHNQQAGLKSYFILPLGQKACQNTSTGARQYIVAVLLDDEYLLGSVDLSVRHCNVSLWRQCGRCATRYRDIPVRTFLRVVCSPRSAASALSPVFRTTCVSLIWSPKTYCVKTRYLCTRLI